MADQKEHKMLKTLLPHIGFRKVKGLIAIVLSFLLWQLVRLFFDGLEVHPIFMYLYGFLEIRDTSEKTVNFGKRRIKAMFIAMVVSLPLIALSEHINSFVTNNIATISIDLAILLFGVLVALLIAEKAKCENFCGIAAIIVIIMMVSHSDGDRYLYAVLRAFQTVGGVFIAWLLNVVLFPYPKKKKE